VALGIGLSGAPAWPCTAFLAEINGSPFVGKSYDWDLSQGLVLVNKRGVQKAAMVFNSGDKPATWTSKYLSVTFNQYGREFPNGGMNEAGLVVEILLLGDTRYPSADARPALNELQWIQYQLDNFASVKEALAVADTLRISPAHAKAHYFMCDDAENCATLEYLEGKLLVHGGAELPLKVLTNNPYAESLKYAYKFKGLGGSEKLKPGTGSLERFARTAAAVANAPEVEKPLDQAFKLLDAVSVGPRSVWNLVYEPREGRISFRTRKEGHVKTIDLSRLDGDCTKPAVMLSIDHAAEGNVTSTFEPYDSAANAKLVKSTVTKSARNLPPQVVKKIAAYPETFPCTESGK